MKTHYDETDDILGYWNDRYVEWAKSPDETIFAAKDAWFETRFAHILPMPEKPAGRVLDYGCGNAMYSVPLLRRFSEYVGIETSQAAVEIAKRFIEPRVDSSRWTVEIGDGRAIAYPDLYFDCVVTITVLQHQPVTLRRLLINEIKRVLRPGGLYVGLEMMGDTRAYDMPPLPEKEWRNAWLPLAVHFDILPDRPEWAADNVWYGRMPENDQR